ncbi:hypothetical protein [Coraliomargarita parva]|uniref:hypothetical protein n=1 Tax=Coraliomargarita parva TaxID=3014050 RepID=UPI0022B46CB8|nr:hypothetical protein [Coraliomargarita parva]
MNLETAIARVKKSFDKMNAAYGRKVFDEIAIVGLAGHSLKLHYYDGPRQSDFLTDFADDSVSLRKELTADQAGLGGEFSFTREGEGAGIDAYICLGPDVYLFCNNTEKSMEEVTADPLWLNAQGQFLTASQFFTVDPLELKD